MARIGRILALGLVIALLPRPSLAETSVRLLDYADLDGWAEDDHAAALSVFQSTCRDMDGAEWPAVCAMAETTTDARVFFELLFRPVLIGGEATALFTGYFEPELQGSTRRTSRYRYPVYRMPPEATGRWLSRREIEESGVLEDRGLEIAWVDDPVELFFLQIQGSGRIRLTDGRVIRVGYGGRNGHEYRSIGQELVRRGIYNAHQVSAQVIQNWVRRNPAAGRDLMYHNPSYVFFREVEISDPSLGPLGAMNRSITPMRTIAVDPRFTPLGAPVWIEKDGAAPMRRLMIAQDTGGAIRGAQRADIFFGYGDAAGREAGTIRDAGRMIVLLPIEEAHRRVPDA
ncbi:Membrane-bound lytic murein transglycosylase A precursor [Roseibacterium elongatum DSM 19469]|uniref:peptidoglycan lytic exotransglycosylase n=1 Tax=Roseicyclus elongatus DSM 19469 TaxID=1294273 RepID=W8RQP7_9RHOB|nr:MltA domain-containing protein [Roseibacterium elongatum]AHM03464.1 Membrane-bound lytic murein transglycosylase A precursor [Roseibacterium elongatum DSM 19469]